MFYQSMNHIVLYTVALVVILVWIGARRNPIMALVEIGKEMLRSYKFLLLMAGMFGVLVLNKYELQIEEKCILPQTIHPLYLDLRGILSKLFRIYSIVHG